MKNTKSEKRQVEDMAGFTLSLALIDALPVLLFSTSSILISCKFQSILFTIGVCCIIAAGVGKVLWKIFLALNNNNIQWLNRQFRYMMLVGFSVVLISMLVHWKQIQIIVIIHKVLGFPTVILFLIGVIGIIVMVILGKRLDGSARSNWIEQITNTIAQGAFFLGLLFMH